jgi:hypothetical protein
VVAEVGEGAGGPKVSSLSNSLRSIHSCILGMGMIYICSRVLNSDREDQTLEPRRQGRQSRIKQSMEGAATSESESVTGYKGSR